MLAVGLCLLVGLPSPWIAIGGFAFAAIPGAAVLGWWLGPRTAYGTTREAVVLALLLGGFAAAAGILTYFAATVVSSMLSSSTLTQPETPLGYVVFPVLLLATLGPFLAVPGALLAGTWAFLLRRIVRSQSVVNR
jgi:hypothetical protein